MALRSFSFGTRKSRSFRLLRAGSPQSITDRAGPLKGYAGMPEDSNACRIRDNSVARKSDRAVLL